MEDAMTIFGMIFDFVKTATFLSFTFNGVSISITFLEVLIGAVVVSIGISVIRHIMGFE